MHETLTVRTRWIRSDLAFASIRWRGRLRLKVENRTTCPLEREFPHGVYPIPPVLDGTSTSLVVHQRRTLVGEGPFRLLIWDKQMRSGSNMDACPLSSPPFPIVATVSARMLGLDQPVNLGSLGPL
eukprot:1357468-Alexandrium_andersonii.AAC.1